MLGVPLAITPEFALRFLDGIEKMRDLVVGAGRWSAAMRVQYRAVRRRMPTKIQILNFIDKLFVTQALSDSNPTQLDARWMHKSGSQRSKLEPAVYSRREPGSLQAKRKTPYCSRSGPKCPHTTW
jgi:hypothetical protein